MWFIIKSWKSNYCQHTGQSWAQKKYLYRQHRAIQLQMYKISFCRWLICKSTRKAMSHTLFMQCMGLKPAVEEILPFVWYMAILAAAVLPCKSFQTSAQSLDFAATDLVKSLSETHWITPHTSPQGYPWFGQQQQQQQNRGLCLGEVQCSPNPGPWEELEQHTSLDFTCAFAGNMIWEMNTRTHFNHQPWQWRWICFNWISLEKKAGHGGK